MIFIDSEEKMAEAATITTNRNASQDISEEAEDRENVHPNERAAFGGSGKGKPLQKRVKNVKADPPLASLRRSNRACTFKPIVSNEVEAIWADTSSTKVSSDSSYSASISSNSISSSSRRSRSILSENVFIRISESMQANTSPANTYAGIDDNTTASTTTDSALQEQEENESEQVEDDYPSMGKSTPEHAKNSFLNLSCTSTASTLTLETCNTHSKRQSSASAYSDLSCDTPRSPIHLHLNINMENWDTLMPSGYKTTAPLKGKNTIMDLKSASKSPAHHSAAKGTTGTRRMSMADSSAKMHETIAMPATPRILFTGRPSFGGTESESSPHSASSVPEADMSLTSTAETVVLEVEVEGEEDEVAQAEKLCDSSNSSNSSGICRENTVATVIDPSQELDEVRDVQKSDIRHFFRRQASTIKTSKEAKPLEMTPAVLMQESTKIGTHEETQIDITDIDTGLCSISGIQSKEPNSIPPMVGLTLPCILSVSAVILDFIQGKEVTEPFFYLCSLQSARALCESNDFALNAHVSRNSVAAAVQYTEHAMLFFQQQPGSSSSSRNEIRTSSVSKGRSKAAAKAASVPLCTLEPAEALIIATLAVACAKDEIQHEIQQSFLNTMDILDPLSTALLSATGGFATEEIGKHRRSGASNYRQVNFNRADGSTISPPKDRLPHSWEDMWTHSSRFLNLVKCINVVAQKCFPSHSRTSVGNDITDLSKQTHHRIVVEAMLAATAALRDPKNPLSKKLARATKNASELQSLAVCIFDETAAVVAHCTLRRYGNNSGVHLSSYSNPENIYGATSRSAATELRRRAKWMTSSVARFQLRYIFDSEPYQISTPGLTGVVDFSKSRSGLYKCIELCPRGPRRMRQLCIPAQATKTSPYIDLFDCIHSREAVFAAVPSPLDVDAAELSTSSLMTRALRQLVSAARDVGDKNNEEVNSIITAPSLSEALQMEEEARGAGLGPDTVQIVLAAEYARRFLCELCLVPGVGDIVTQSNTTPAPKVWSILAQCAAAAQDLATTDDAFILFFTDGWESYQMRIQEPLISSAFIAECQSLFHQYLKQDAIFRAKDKDNCDKQAPGEVDADADAEHDFDPTFFRLVRSDAIMDFPQVRLIH